MGWQATGHPTVRKQRDKWTVRVDGNDTETGKHRPHHLAEIGADRCGRKPPAQTSSQCCQVELRVEPMPLTFRHDIGGAADHADSGLVVDRVRGTVETGSPSLGAGQRVVG